MFLPALTPLFRPTYTPFTYLMVAQLGHLWFLHAFTPHFRLTNLDNFLIYLIVAQLGHLFLPVFTCSDTSFQANLDTLINLPYGSST